MCSQEEEDDCRRLLFSLDESNMELDSFVKTQMAQAGRRWEMGDDISTTLPRCFIPGNWVVVSMRGPCLDHFFNPNIAHDSIVVYCRSAGHVLLE
jgi:hypothetical protein